MQTPAILITLLIVMNFFWAGSYAVVKLGLGSMEPIELVFWRFLAAFIILAGWVAIKRYPLKMKRGDAFRIVGSGLLLAASNWLWVTGIGLSHATDASLLYIFEPVWGIFLASLILKERLRISMIVGMILVLIGFTRLSGFSFTGFGLPADALALGNAILVISFLAESFYLIVLKPAAARVPAPLVGMIALGVAVIVFSVPMGLAGGFSPPTDARSLISLAYLVLICTVIGYTLWVHVMKHVPVGIMLFTIFIQPLIGPLVAAALLGEKIDTRVIFGGAFLIAGMFAAIAGHLRSRRRAAIASGDAVLPAVGEV